jgi:hypothetical protein
MIASALPETALPGTLVGFLSLAYLPKVALITPSFEDIEAGGV